MESTLPGLAPELLLSVANKLEHPKDLNALIQTCRRFYSILDRELYRADVRWHGSSALLWAAKHGHVGTLQKSLAEGADPSGPRETGVANRVTITHMS